MKRTLIGLLLILYAGIAGATKLMEIRVVDKDILCLRFRDGEVHYRDDGTGPSAYLGHTFVDGDDTLFTFLPRLNTRIAADVSKWTVSCSGKTVHPVAIYRKSKPMNTDHTLKSEVDHWLFLRLPSSMKQGKKYTVNIPAECGSDCKDASIVYDIWKEKSEAVHVNIIGYSPAQKRLAADLYLWLGDGGERDYSAFQGNKVWLYDVNSAKKKVCSSVSFWKSHDACSEEAGRKDLTGSAVWTIDFDAPAPGKYRLVVDGVGSSMDFEVSHDIYREPYRYSVLGYYYMRLGEPMGLTPAPRQPRFIPGEDPEGFIVYKTDLHPWHPVWRTLRGDVWDEPHFKGASQSAFWKHRLEGNPVNNEVRGGHSDAMDWDRHLAHVVNIYDMLLPYILTDGRLNDDNLGIRESGNGIPDIMDEARNEVDFFLSIRDGEAYSQGVTNPDRNWTVMFQAGCTTMAAWANAANCAMMAEAFRISGNAKLAKYYADEAVKAFLFASRQENSQLDDRQGIGNESMLGREFRQMAAAFLYNFTGDTRWEDIMASESKYKVWGMAAYLTCPHEIHYPELKDKMQKQLESIVLEKHLEPASRRPSRRAADDPRWITSENLQYVILAHSISSDGEYRGRLEDIMYNEAGWGLGRNPGNVVEMTGLGQRHITDVYSPGRNDGVPGTLPGQTPFNGTETWSQGDGGDARIILNYCYPSWWDGGWPRQESWFNQRYFWVNSEFTPRETMRGKMALLAYLYGIRP